MNKTSAANYDGVELHVARIADSLNRLNDDLDKFIGFLLRNFEDAGDLSGDLRGLKRIQNQREKADSLTNLMKTRGILSQLVVLLAEWFLNEAGGNPNLFTKQKMHEELFLAVVDLWTMEWPEKRLMVMSSLDKLAKMDPTFKKEWEACGGANVFSDNAQLRQENIVSLADLTSHLKECNKLHAKAEKQWLAHEWAVALETRRELQNLQPGFHDTDYWCSAFDKEEIGSRIGQISATHAFVSGFDRDDLKNMTLYLGKNYQSERAFADDLSYAKLKGADPSTKILHLIADIVVPNKRYSEFVAYVSAWCLKKKNGLVEVFKNAGMQEQLFAAVKELSAINQPDHHGLITDSLTLLASLDEDFEKEWNLCNEGMAFANDTQLIHESVSSLPEFTAHLAKCRIFYENASAKHLAHRWIAARDGYGELHSLQPGYRDGSAWYQKLNGNKLLERLDTFCQKALSGLIYDERLAALHDSLYLKLHRAGVPIVPNSTAKQIQDTVSSLDENFPERDLVRQNLESLSEQGPRNVADAFLLPARITDDALSSFEMAVIESNGNLALIKPEEHGTGKSSDALSFLWDEGDGLSVRCFERQQMHPRDGYLAHCSALLHTARALDGNLSESSRSAAEWTLAISQWAVTLSDIDYWTPWCKGRALSYGLSPDAFRQPTVETLQQRLFRLLRDHLQKHNEQFALDFDAEIEAVKISRLLGGIVVENTEKIKRRICFGPLWMDQFRWTGNVADFVAGELKALELLPDAEKDDRSTQLRRFRWYFSSLRNAAVMMEKTVQSSDLVISAIDMCGNCEKKGNPGRCPQKKAVQFPESTECIEWKRFAVCNPGYAALSDQNEAVRLFRKDALILAVNAHLLSTKRMLSATQAEGQEPTQNVSSIQEEWREAVRLAKLSNDASEISHTEKEILTCVLDRRRIAHSKNEHQAIDTEIQLLILCRSLIEKESALVTVRLAEAYTFRGNKRQDEGRELLEAEQDFREALALAPQLHVARTELAMVWFRQANQVVYENRFLARELVRRAEELLHEGETRFPGHDYSNVLTLIAETRKNLTEQNTVPVGDDPFVDLRNALGTADVDEATKLYSTGIRLIREDRPEGAIVPLQRSLELSAAAGTTDPAIEEAFRTAVLKQGRMLVEQNRAEEATRLIDDANARLTCRPINEQQKQLLRHWPRLRFLLNGDKPKLIYDANGFEEITMRFRATNPEGLAVRSWFIDGERFCLACALPPSRRLIDESLIRDLLIVSREMFGYKIWLRDQDTIELVSVVDFRLFDVRPRFAEVCWGFAYYADVQLANLTDLDSISKRIGNAGEEFRRDLCPDPKEATHIEGARMALKRVCTSQNLSSKHVIDTGGRMVRRVAAPFGAVEVEARIDGCRLSIDLGPFSPKLSEKSPFSDLAKLNGAYDIGKYYLTKSSEGDFHLVMSVEQPLLDVPSITMGLDFIRKKVQLHAKDGLRGLQNAPA